MTLESRVNKNRYVGNGATRKFPFTFKVWKTNQILVLVGDGTAEQDVSAQCAVEVTASGGTVSFPSAPPAGTVIVIRRRMPYVQEDDYINGTRFNSEEIEDRLDMDCAERQDLRLDVDRAVKVPDTSEQTQDAFVASIFAARDEAQEAAANVQAWLAEIGSDIGDHTYVTADGSDVARTLTARFGDVVNVKDFGAKGDGNTNDYEAITAAFNVASTSGKTVVFPTGNYKLSSSVVLSDFGSISIDGCGSTLIYDNYTPSAAFSFKATPSQQNIDYTDEIEKDTMSLTNVFGNLSPGDLLHIKTTELIKTDYREGWTNGFICRVNRITNDGVKLSDPFPLDVKAKATLTATVVSVSGDSVILSGINKPDNSISYLTQKGATNLYIVSWNNTTKKATFIDDVSNILSAGDTLKVIIKTVCDVYHPISVSIRNITLKRERTYDGRKGFRGIEVSYGSECFIENVHIMNFDLVNARYMRCYKSYMRNCIFEGGTDIYNGGTYKSGGLGYGATFNGSSLCVVDSCEFKSNRCGFTTTGYDVNAENGNTRTVKCVLKNCTFVAPEGLSVDGVPLVPETSVNASTTLKCYAFGGHGDALGMIYKDNVIIDYGVGSSIRDEDVIFDGNVFVGQMLVAFKFENFDGAIVRNNLVYPSNKVNHTRFARLQLGDGNYSSMRNDRQVVFENNQAIGVNEAFLDLAAMTDDDETNVLRNTVIRNNYVRLAAGGLVLNKGGILARKGDQYISEGNVVVIDSSCALYNNDCAYDVGIAANHKKGFLGYGWRMNLNSFIQISKNMFRCALEKNGGNIDIPLTNNDREFTLTVSGWSLVGDESSGQLYPVQGIVYRYGLDSNPITKQYTMDYIHTTSEYGRIKLAQEENIVDGLDAIWFYNNGNQSVLAVKNTSSVHNFYFDLTISQRD